MRLLSFLIVFAALPFACREPQKSEASVNQYFDNTGRDDVFSGGVKLIRIKTSSGEHSVWTKRVGNNPKIKLLLLHGGPGMTHEYFECADSFLPAEGIEYYYYDQLESAYSDQPHDTTLWTVERYVDEVEQVRQALHLDKSNFYLLGHSWGGILAMEYGLKYQDHLKGLIISNMMSSVPEYNKYAQEVLGPQLPPDVLKEVQAIEARGDYKNPKYEELLFEHFYTAHILRRPVVEWPEPATRSFSKLSKDLYVSLQGPSEFGITKEAKLFNWDRSGDLKNIAIPTLVIGASHDTMDPKHMEWMSKQIPNGRFLLCTNGSHMSMYDDQVTYFEGIVKFMKEVDQAK